MIVRVLLPDPSGADPRVTVLQPHRDDPVTLGHPPVHLAGLVCQRIATWAVMSPPWRSPMKSSLTFDRAALTAFFVSASVAAGVLTSAVPVQPAHADAQPSAVRATTVEDAPQAEHDDGEQVPEDMLTWSIQPAPAEDDDADEAEGDDAAERVSFRFEVEPGETIEDEVIVTEEGLFDLLPDPEESSDAGTWIELEEDEVTIPAGDFATVPFTVTVPDDALPGDHPAGIAASLAADAEGNDVSLAAQVGARIHLRVAVDIVPTVAIQDLNAQYTPSWNPFAPGVLSLDWTVENTGNVRLGSEQALAVEGLFGLNPGVADQTVASQREILPGQSASGSVEVEAWPLGPLTSTMNATQNIVGDDEIEVELTSASSETTVWAVPWVYLIAFLLVVGLIVTVVVRRRRRKRAMADALAAARAEGARAAAAERSEKAQRTTQESGELSEETPGETKETVS